MFPTNRKAQRYNSYVSLPLVVWFLTACSSQPIQQTEIYAFERPPEKEQGEINEIALKTIKLQKLRSQKRQEQNSKILRGVHPKSHGCVAANFVVNSDIPEDYQVGIFSNPGAQQMALIRYSNAAVTLSHDLKDGKNNSRGMAIKLIDVSGDVLVGDRGRKSQDFLMINTPQFAFPNVSSYLRLTNALLDSDDGTDPSAAFDPTRLPREALPDLQKTGAVVGQIEAQVVSNPIEVQYFAAAPSMFGNDRVMKFPASHCDGPIAQVLNEDQRNNPDYLHTALAATLAQDAKICLNFAIQTMTDVQVEEYWLQSPDKPDPIEDATSLWEGPFINVAKLTIEGPQDLRLTSESQLECQRQAFNP